MSHNLDRRTVLASAAGLGLASLAAAASQPDIIANPNAKKDLTPQQLGWDPTKAEFALPPLPYDKAALEPHIDAQTMEIHHTKHHAAYVAGLNKAISELARIREGQGDPALVKHWSRELSFHGSGHINHTLFWHMLAPAGKGGGGQPSGPLASAIEKDFGSFERFAAHFKAAAGQVEGGGWAWLVQETFSKKLLIIQEEKQQDLMLTNCRPLLGIDVWEHAYYLKYQNKRTDYVNAFMNIVNWSFVASRLA